MTFRVLVNGREVLAKHQAERKWHDAGVKGLLVIVLVRVPVAIVNGRTKELGEDGSDKGGPIVPGQQDRLP